jgi:hypothetical protein
MRRLPRAVAVAFFALTLAFSLVTGLSLAGATYYYCDAMGLTASDPCQGADRSSHECEQPIGSLRKPKADCCEKLTLRSMPPGATTPDRAVPPAPLVAVLAPAELVQAASADLPHASLPGLERWGPPPPLASERCVQRMVFLS